MKKSLLPFAFFLVAGLSFATGASAQPYVGGSILVDIVRASGPVDDTPGSGEAIGGGLRIGVALRNQWGIDLEFIRSGEVEWQPDVRILADVTRSLPGVFGVPPNISIFPSPQFSSETQLSTLTTMLWWRQEVNDRFDLVYLGGAAFTRTATDSTMCRTSCRRVPGCCRFRFLSSSSRNRSGMTLASSSVSTAASR